VRTRRTLLVGERVAELLDRLEERVAPGVLPEHDLRARGADVLAAHDLVGQAVGEHPVLVDPGLVGERVLADDGLVLLHRVAGEARDEPRGARQLTRVQPVVAAEQVRTRADRHDDLLERAVPGALADAVDRDLDLARPVAHRLERVRDGEPEVVVAVHAQRDAALADGRDTPLELGDPVPEVVRERVADGVGDVDGRRTGLDGRRDDVDEELEVGARRVLRRELDVVREGLRHLDRTDRLLEDLVLVACSMYLRWMSDVERNVWMRRRRAGSMPFQAASMSPSSARASAAMTGGSRSSVSPSLPPGPAAARGALPICSATARTAARSPADAAGKPASMTSTRRRASCSAISTFSCASREIPGDCSPSRRVVSKMTMSRGWCPRRCGLRDVTSRCSWPRAAVLSARVGGRSSARMFGGVRRPSPCPVLPPRSPSGVGLDGAAASKEEQQRQREQHAVTDDHAGPRRAAGAGGRDGGLACHGRSVPVAAPVRDRTPLTVRRARISAGARTPGGYRRPGTGPRPGASRRGP
jgi:hypothetical protein